MPLDAHDRRAQLSLERILPRLDVDYAALAGAEDWAVFKTRLAANFPRLFGLLVQLYGGQYDFFYQLEAAVGMAARLWLARPAELKQLDAAREAQPGWFQAQEMVGGVCYVDLFAGNLAGMRAKIPYFKELGLTYLHLMPLFLAPAGNSDGGYAVSSYREVNPQLGTMQELSELAAEFRRNGISLVLDFVFNHTSNEHTWARQALAGDPEYQDYYFMFPDRTVPDQYERNLREIFPEERPGNFTWAPQAERWVWTTFYSFQWDLNYANAAVFRAIAEEMLFLANQGVEILRLDALAFIWKRMSTTCENLPEAHLLVQAFNALCRIAAPSLLFKSEAIVHPDFVNQYISAEECQISYNPLLMALGWEALATRDVKLLRQSLSHRFRINPACAWINYVRSHDDIGWTFDDADAGQVGINGYNHRQFLNSFYMGRYDGSFARGLPFQENPRTGDARISGTAASLAGVEKGLRENNAAALEEGIRRVLLLYSLALSMGGIPLIYLGDEVGTPNDYSYRDDPAKAGDSRWVHRPYTDWQKMARRNDPSTPEGSIYTRLLHMIRVRKSTPALADGDMELVDAGNGAVLGYVRQYQGQRVVALANFSDAQQSIVANQLRLYGLSYSFKELVSGREINLDSDLLLAPHEFVWLAAL